MPRKVNNITCPKCGKVITNAKLDGAWMYMEYQDGCRIKYKTANGVCQHCNTEYDIDVATFVKKRKKKV